MFTNTGVLSRILIRIGSSGSTQNKMTQTDIRNLMRENIRNLAPYSTARDEYQGGELGIFLDANENPYDNGVNRYPDPHQRALKARLSEVKGVPVKNIFVGNGSDEAIDLMYRVFCEPRISNAISIAPTYGMYKVAAAINDVEMREVQLEEDFSLIADKLLAVADENSRLLWICSPNNPTGNNLDSKEIITLLNEFQGIVIVDEAYADFSDQPSFTGILDEYPNLIILQTFSKAWGCAAIRLGMAFASPEIIGIFTKIKYPYNINRLTQQEAISMMQRHYEVQRWVNSVLEERTRLMKAFAQLPCCKRIFPTDANFFLTRVTHAKAIYDYLVGQGIIVRNRSNVTLCEDCLRITIGTRPENDKLLEALRNYSTSDTK